jgi:hypothetical protein
MLLAPTLVPWKVTLVVLGLVMVGAVALNPDGEVIVRFVTGGPIAAPLAAKVAVCRSGCWALPLKDQLMVVVTRLKSSAWLSADPAVALSEHQEWLPEVCAP